VPVKERSASGSWSFLRYRTCRRERCFGLRFGPKVTTRPMRANERDGIDYSFATDEDFSRMVSSGEIKTGQSFEVNGSTWHYAITEKNFRENQVFIMTPHEISLLGPEERKECFVVFLSIDEQTRLSRVTKRFDQNDSVARRFVADIADFEGFADYDMKVTDPEFDAEVVYHLMR
jgi:guanylate kinase